MFAHLFAKFAKMFARLSQLFVKFAQLIVRLIWLVVRLVLLLDTVHRKAAASAAAMESYFSIDQRGI